MKLIYSHLKKFIPELSVDPKKLRDDLTMIGHFCNFYEEIENEIVFDLDIKVNRGDCLGYYGLARDLSVYYKLPLVTPTVQIPKNSSPLDIKVTTSNVTRIKAVKISQLKNSDSPEWLSKFVRIHGTNSINILVDLTNYIMFLYGIPNHAFDTRKSGTSLIWEMNSKYSEFTSLDGSVLPLNNDILMINNPQKPLSLSFWGGESCAIDMDTTETIIEVAVYNPTTVRQNSRQLKAATEAATRLEKDLDANLIDQALAHLATLIVEMTHGQISSDTYDYYPAPQTPPQIDFDLELSSRLAGIEIPREFSLDILKRLGANIDNGVVTPPTIRKDITIAEDVAEEVIRFFGYYNIPISNPLPFKEVKNVTPKEIYLIDQLKDQLVSLGYDEVLTWPLVNEPLDKSTVITTQNSINSESIFLRQSLIPSLTDQLKQYNRYKLEATKFFEVGKVFSKDGDEFVEKNSLGVYNQNQQELQDDLNTIINNKQISFQGQFAEVFIDDLPKPESYVPSNQDNQAIELTSQIITLDANVTIENPSSNEELIKKYSAQIDNNILWSMEIVDIYQNRYTFRVSYYNCDDKVAKSIHLKTFNLN